MAVREMEFKDVRVQVTNGDGRQTMTILHGLKDLGCQITVLCTSKKGLCYRSNAAQKKVLDTRATSKIVSSEHSN